MKTKWTQGPWHLARHDDWGRLVSVETKDDYIADCNVGSGDDRDEANARLIAAAPDLYDALFGLFSLVLAQGYGIGPGEKPVLKDGVADQKIAAARAALAKAEGESS